MRGLQAEEEQNHGAPCFTAQSFYFRGLHP